MQYSEVISTLDINRELKSIKHRGFNKNGDLEKNVGSGTLINSLFYSNDNM